MYTESTKISTRSKSAFATSVSSAVPNEANLPALLLTLSEMLCRAVLPGLTILTWMPFLLKVRSNLASCLLASRSSFGTLSLNLFT